MRESELSTKGEIVITRQCSSGSPGKEVTSLRLWIQWTFYTHRGRGSAPVAGDICKSSSSTWLGTSPLAHSPLSAIHMRRSSPAQHRLLRLLCDVYASPSLACGLETWVIKNNHRSVQLVGVAWAVHSAWVQEVMYNWDDAKEPAKNLPWSSSAAFQFNGSQCSGKRQSLNETEQGIFMHPAAVNQCIHWGQGSFSFPLHTFRVNVQVQSKSQTCETTVHGYPRAY